MAKNTGGNGSGASKIPGTPEQQNAIRRAAKKNRNKGKKGYQPAEPLMDGIKQDREERRAETEAERAERRAALLERVFADTLGHLKRFGDQQVPGYASMRPRWTVTAQAASEQLLRLYFFGPAEDIEVREKLTGKNVIGEVRRRFAGACFKNRGVYDTPGQAQPWFADALADAERFHTTGKIERRLKNASRATNATTVTAEPTAETVEPAAAAA